jgi:Concanavalin A-like lectin/glucanases superfamily
MKTSVRLAIAGSIASILVLMLSSSVLALTVTPVAVWHMDETDGTTMIDSTSNHNDGTLVDVLVGQPGKTGTAYLFNGTSAYVTVPSSDTLNPGTSSFGVIAWVNFTVPPTMGSDYDIVRKGYAGTTGGQYKMYIATTRVATAQARCAFQDAAQLQTYVVKGGPNLADGVWHQIRCIKTSTSVQLFVDGTTYLLSASLGSIANNKPVVLGANLKSHSDYFNGTIDEVSISLAS